jgi:Raf kinase inhibitor-like YbhB/YbcL family protein
MLVCIIALHIHPAYALSLTTNAVLDGGTIPVLYTCDGKDIQPAFRWTDVPVKTETFAIIMSDPDAPSGTFYHWILFNMPKNTKELPEGMTTLPKGAVLGKNSFDKTGYNGPCPPKGTAHTYIVTLYALDTKLNLAKNADAQTVLKAMENHIVEQATFKMVYSR